MKKIIAIALTAMMALTFFTGCGETTVEPTTLQSIKNAGKLSIATSPDFPPFEYLDDNGNVVGIEIDILNLICEELGVELEINQIDFENVLPGLQTGKFDVGVSGITITEKRQKNALFTAPYCLAAQAIVVVEGSEITTKADLEGKKVSVQTGTTAESFCMENSYEVSSFSANSDAQTALTTGKVDAWVIDDLTAADMVKVYNEDNDVKLVILDEAMTTEPYAFAFRLGSDELVDEINTILNGLIADGTIQAIFDKYEAPYTSPENN